MDRDTKVMESVIFHVKSGLHREGCNTIDDDYQDNLYRVEIPYYVKVIKGWPSNPDDIFLPTVAVTESDDDEIPLQIGGGKYNRKLGYIEIFTEKDNDRDFLKTMIRDYLRDYSTYVRNYEEATPLYLAVGVPEDFILTEYWPSGMATAESELWFEDVRSTVIPPMNTVGEVDNHRAQVSFTAVSLR
ncbi:MAG: hypothetical protein WC476_01155 [Phycisphaerae bacterium]